MTKMKLFLGGTYVKYALSQTVDYKILSCDSSSFSVKQLHREFLNAGADLIQAFTFHTTEGRLKLFNPHQQVKEYSVSCTYKLTPARHKRYSH